MMNADESILCRRLRRTGVAAAVVALFFGTPCANAVTPPPPDNAWLRIRADPARRIFATMPAAGMRHQSPSPNAKLPVLNCADDGPGSLRAIIGSAKDGDTIDLTQLTCATITLETGAIKIPVENLTLVGPGRTHLAIDGNALDRVFLHAYGNGTLSLNAMTIQKGRDRATGFHVAGGACIASAGYLVLDATTVRNCYAGGEGAYGGGIYAYSLKMANSTLSGNTAIGVHADAGTAAFGGGAFVYAMDLADSTVSGNRAIDNTHVGRSTYDIGGGIVTVTGGAIVNSTIDSNYSRERGGGIVALNPIFVSNSTFSGNVAATNIGGAFLVRWPSTIELNNSTVTANHAAIGGGIWLGAPGSTMQSSIVYGNRADDGLSANFGTNVALAVTGDHNLVGDSDPAISLPADSLSANPLLDVLAFNGGPTRTHALLRGSPAVDAGTDSAALASDQRGGAFPRSFGAAPDIGAFEQQALPAAAQNVPVPTLSTAWLGLLAACFGLIGGRRLRSLRASNAP